MKNNYTEDQRQKVCDLVYNWINKHECHSGEQAAQSDECTVNAIDLVCDLADVVGLPYDFD